MMPSASCSCKFSLSSSRTWMMISDGCARGCAWKRMPSQPWESIAQRLLLLPEISRSDLGTLASQAVETSSRPDAQAFTYLTNLLLISPDARDERNAAQNRRFISELIQFAVILLSVFVLRAWGLSWG